MFFERKSKNRIPSIFRRTPFYARLPAWSRDQVKSVGKSYTAIRHKLSRVRWRVPLWALVCAVFAVGFLSGMLMMKQRQMSREVVVSVKGVPITAPDFHRRLEIEAGPQVLRKMVNEELTLQYARQHGVLPSDSRVAARVKAGQTEPGVNQYLLRTHQSPEDLARQVRVKLAEAALFGQNVTVTDTDVRQFYRRESDPANPRARFYIPESAQLKVIVTTSQQSAEKAFEELTTGASFSSVAKKYSVDKSAAAGGEIAPVLRGRSRAHQVPGFEEAIFALSPGEQSGPRRFGGAWWIIACQDKKPAVTRPFAQVETQCREAARLQKAVVANTGQVLADFEAFRKKTQVQVFWEQYLYDLTGETRSIARAPR